MTKIKNKGASPRQTKIIATLGPATDNPEVFRALFDAGIDAVRLNFSHGDSEEHIRRANAVRELSAKLHYHVAIIGDLQGPKIRTERFAEGSVILEKGAPFDLVADLGRDEGDVTRVGLTYRALSDDVRVDDELLLDDGRIQLKVLAIRDGAIKTEVIVGGGLSGNKGINRRGGGLSAPSITGKDCEDARVAAAIGVDYLAVSFPCGAADMLRAHELVRDVGLSGVGVIAKIERAEAIDNIEDIMKYCNGIMVARGDLSLEIGDAELTAVQKRLLRLGRENSKIVITATEMMQSMITSTVPTRAEISDVANAVLDGTDAVMLSAETAIGEHPVEAVEAMSRVCSGAEKNAKGMMELTRVKTGFSKVDSAVAMATIYTATGLKAAAIAALTESGSTPFWMSRVLSPIPVYALTPHEKTCRKVTLYRGVYPWLIGQPSKTHAEANQATVNALKQCQAVSKGDIIIITKGDLAGERGGTNAMKIIYVD